MILENIENNPSAAFLYMDRYVNDGSPSGFTEQNTTSYLTTPFSQTKAFDIFYIKADLEVYTKENEEFDDKIYIHPDMINNDCLKPFNINKELDFLVAPTSSFRTVKILSSFNDAYIKLHYDGIIGRIYRHLTREKAIAGVEVSFEIAKSIKNQILSPFVSIFREPYAKILTVCKNGIADTWGMVWREGIPYGNNQIRYIIPLFSLWSKDRIEKTESTVFEQLFIKWGEGAINKYMDEILIPILDNYFELLVYIGLQNEYNAQNILIGFDESWNAVAIINRDMMGIEKDLFLRNQLGLSITFDSTPYKILSMEDPLYTIRHSFAFDFKVCKYVIEPLINNLPFCNGSIKEEMIIYLRERTKYWIQKLPDKFFPKNKWYSHNKTLLTEKDKRIYIENKFPLLR